MTKYTLNDMRLIAHEREGECLSVEYININTPLEWECSKKHIWKTKGSHILGGSWCPVCAKKKQLTLSAVQKASKKDRRKK